jgi:hypothetical protein
MEIRIASFRDQVSAGMIHEILTSRGMHPRPLDTASHISIAGADLWYHIYVPKEEAEKAKKVLTEFVDEKNFVKQ